MLPGSASDPAVRSLLPRPPLLVRAEHAVRRHTLPALGRAPLIEHDATLLVAALADVREQQAALEWLRDADLFGACLR
jgi:hypothetical protein